MQAVADLKKRDGNLFEAREWYNRAIAVDPKCAIAYSVTSQAILAHCASSTCFSKFMQDIASRNAFNWQGAMACTANMDQSISEEIFDQADLHLLHESSL